MRDRATPCKLLNRLALSAGNQVAGGTDIQLDPALESRQVFLGHPSKKQPDHWQMYRCFVGSYSTLEVSVDRIFALKDLISH
jgi:hypothetical protein